LGVQVLNPDINVAASDFIGLAPEDAPAGVELPPGSPGVIPFGLSAVRNPEQLAKLRQPVDAFFDKVTVNVEGDPKLRENRLKLLNGIRAATGTVADFSRIEG
jgi:hypothetical protein